MADYTLANAGSPTPAATGHAAPAPQTFEIDVDLTNLSSVLAAGDTVDVFAHPANFVILGAYIETTEVMTGTSLVGPLFNLELETGSVDLTGTMIPTTVGNSSMDDIKAAPEAAGNVELVFALTSGTVTGNGKYKVRILGCYLGV